MIEWFNQLNTLQQIFTLIAIPSTLIVVLQTILLMFGIGEGGGDMDGSDLHVDTSQSSDVIGDDGLSLFTIRGIMAFLCISGWSGMAFAGTSMNSVLAIFLSTLCGFIALVGMAYIIKIMLSLQSSGNIDLANAIGKVGQVYIPIPGNAKGSGKITVVVQGSFSEISAITNETETLKTGEAVRVVATDETGFLVVERLRK
ncbi:MAG: hypothetical protein A2Y15_01205 [Clostridiales bacterium GWF2_36_10]|nr:MAG: hypothetical protein A2Y15_01205 [Clostridiales bacterium GWF2_36_10]HAN22020.1 hypothetical protein [Clostridiales bacterium]